MARIIGTFTIVGLPYYSGEAHCDEIVLLIHETNNLYDRNAICVKNCAGEKVGYVKKTEAVDLVQLISNKKNNLRGRVLHEYPSYKTMQVEQVFC